MGKSLYKKDETFLTADTHLGHNKFITEGIRPEFASVEEMDDFFIKAWNDVLSQGGTIIHAGDVAWRRIEDYMKRVHSGKIILVRGNHDFGFKIGRLQKLFHQVVDQFTIKVEDNIEIFVSHYAHLVWPKSHYGSYHAFGHSHGKLENPQPRSADVGVDAIEGYKMISVKDFINKFN